MNPSTLSFDFAATLLDPGRQRRRPDQRISGHDIRIPCASRVVRGRAEA